MDFSLSESEHVNNALDQINKAAEEKDHPMHLVILATNDQSRPEMRYVVWRKFNPEKASGWIFTDIRSNKIEQIKAENSGQLLFYNHSKKCQIKVDVRINIHHQDKQTEEIYSQIERGKSSYNTLDAPGTVKENFADTTKMKEVYNGKDFAILATEFEQMEVLILNEPNHIRFTYDFKKQLFKWLVP